MTSIENNRNVRLPRVFGRFMFIPVKSNVISSDSYSEFNSILVLLKQKNMGQISLKEFLKIDNGLLYQEYLNEDKQIYDKMYHQFFAQELIDSCSKHEIFLMKSFPIDKA